MSKKIVITGASGFVGANLTRRLIALGHDIYLLLRPDCKTWRLNDVLSHVGTRFTQLQDIESLYITLNEIKPDWIFHLACYGAYSWQTDWREMVETNLLGSINMMECASKIGVGAFVNSGCFSEYGSSPGATPESQSLDPKDYYALTKSAQTMAACKPFTNKMYLPTLRLYSVYGPWQSPQELIPNLILYGLKNVLPPNLESKSSDWKGTLNHLKDYVYIDDVIDAYISAAQQPADRDLSPIFNVGTGKQTSTKKLIDISIKEFDLKVRNKIASFKNGDSYEHEDDTSFVSAMANITKIRKSLDWYPSIELEVGFKKFATWFRENPEFVELYKSKLSQTCP
ncbi:MAG: NAD(P)-dependent oxidoreductase [Cyanobacteria bacterium TGS_CYA1]|nr:NAD(P)-dependent oxidoreductase [Cyanobacteria bacterium TGS_CYA1]